MKALQTVMRVWGCVAMLVSACATQAADWPSRPIRIIVPAGPGSTPDVGTRLIAERMGAELKQSVIIDNRVGAGGIVAMRNFQTGKDDDHTFLLVITSTASIAPLVLKAASSFDYVRDVQPVVRFAQTPLMIVANPATGLKSLSDLLKVARQKPGQIPFATPGQSTLGGLTAMLISQSTGTQFNTVPFSRQAEAISALVSGDASFYVDGISVVLPFVRSQKLQPIAVLSATKLPGLEAYPLGRETINGLEVVGRFGLVTSKNVPPEVIEAMSRATKVALADPGVVSKLTDLAIYPHHGTAAEYEQTLRQEIELWSKVVRQAGLKPE